MDEEPSKSKWTDSKKYEPVKVTKKIKIIY